MIFFKTLGFLFFLFAICSCQVKDDKKSDTVEDTGSTPITLDSKTLAEFNVWTDRWERKGREYTKTHGLFKYMDFPEFDLSQVGSNSKAVIGRGYMALDSIPATAKDTMYYMPHVLLVGIDKNGDFTGSIYDYTTLCPPKCSN